MIVDIIVSNKVPIISVSSTILVQQQFRDLSSNICCVGW